LVRQPRPARRRLPSSHEGQDSYLSSYASLRLT
jgi:hypothetical protein